MHVYASSDVWTLMCASHMRLCRLAADQGDNPVALQEALIEIEKDQVHCSTSVHGRVPHWTANVVAFIGGSWQLLMPGCNIRDAGVMACMQGPSHWIASKIPESLKNSRVWRTIFWVCGSSLMRALSLTRT